MVVVHRAGGLRFVIYTDDHMPAHVHVYGDGEAWIEIAGPDGLPLMHWSAGFNRKDEWRMMDEVRDHQPHLMSEWRRIHG